jgi:hypothetical protein
MPDLDDLTAFAQANRHNLTDTLRHDQVIALAEAWLPEVRFHERERFHPIDLPGMLTLATDAFNELPVEEQDEFRVAIPTGGSIFQPTFEFFTPPVVLSSAGVLGSGADASAALDDLDRLGRSGVITHGANLGASRRLFGATTTLTGADTPTAGDPRVPRHPVVVGAELRMLFEALKHELQLDNLPPALAARGLPIDTIWAGFAVENSFFQRDQTADPENFPRAARRTILRNLVDAYESDPTAQPQGIPAGWQFITRAWEALTRYAFLEFNFVYAFNDYKEYGDSPFANEHEGDVEGCCVIFERQSLERFAAGTIELDDVMPHSLITAAHEEFQELDSLKRLSVDRARARDDLLVYVAPGSHGSYLTPGSHDILDFEDIVTDLPFMLPTWGILAGLMFPGTFAALVISLAATEHFIDAEDVTSDNGASIGPGPDPEPGGLQFGKRVDVTPLSDIEDDLNIYQNIPGMRARLATRGFPGKWGGDDDLVDKSPPWENKTARYFRRFLRSSNIAPSPVVD